MQWSPAPGRDRRAGRHRSGPRPRRPGRRRDRAGAGRRGALLVLAARRPGRRSPGPGWPPAPTASTCACWTGPPAPAVAGAAGPRPGDAAARRPEPDPGAGHRRRSGRRRRAPACWAAATSAPTRRRSPGRSARWTPRPADLDRSRLVNPSGSSRKTSSAASRAWARASAKRSPAVRVPSPVRTGSLTAANTSAPRAGSWLSRWTPSRRRLAEKPISRRAGRLVSRFPIRKSRVSLIVVSVRNARPSLWYCLIVACL